LEGIPDFEGAAKGALEQMDRLGLEKGMDGSNQEIPGPLHYRVQSVLHVVKSQKTRAG